MNKYRVIINSPSQLQAQGYIAYFKHVSNINGFAIKGQPEPEKRHACLRYGYWCWENLREYPSDLLLYIIVETKHYINLLRKLFVSSRWSSMGKRNTA